MLSIAVPTVFNSPSLNELSINFSVSLLFKFSSSIIALRSASFFSFTNLFQSSSTFVAVFTVSIKPSISSFLLLKRILELTALSISTSISLSSQLLAWYLDTNINM